MTKYKFLIMMIFGLLISNLILLFMVIRQHQKHDGPKKEIIEKLQLEPEQIQKYEQLIQSHRKAIHDNEEKMNQLRSELYLQLPYDQNNNLTDSLIAQIGLLQNMAEHTNYNHLLEIKKLCKPNQIDSYKSLSKEVVNLFSPRKGK